jgi:SAM-dependent methyltransferase
MTDERYDSWHRPEVAQQMAELSKLKFGDHSHPPYKYFLEAMNWLYVQTRGIWDGPSFNFLDAGCGIGQYAPLVQWVAPIDYTGFDFSEAMIEQARLTPVPSNYEFLVADAKTFDYSPYSIVLASSLIEVVDRWDDVAQRICETARQYVLLHRVRFHSAPTVREEHEGYEGQPTYAWVHDPVELEDFFESRGFCRIYLRIWPEFQDRPFGMATYIFRRVHG